jgi:hypothetical protein
MVREQWPNARAICVFEAQVAAQPSTPPPVDQRFRSAAGQDEAWVGLASSPGKRPYARECPSPKSGHSGRAPDLSPTHVEHDET